MGDAAGAPTVIPPQEHEVDEDHDSALGADDIQSDTTSLASTILRHREEWGRTYHKFRSGQNDYWGPNDDQQNDQLDIGHHMLTLLLNHQLYLVPLNPSKPTPSALDGASTPFRVLDVGCGTGLWAMDFAEAWPNAEVNGIDLSPIQPTWVPPNCFFSIDDVESEWTFPYKHFDFVHIRCLMGSIGDWPTLYRQAYEHMAPGGWIQHLDMDISFVSDDGTVGDDHIMAQWSKTFVDAGEKMGKTFNVPDRMQSLIHDAGFVDLHQVWYKVPVGGWTKDKLMKQIGQWNYYYCLQGCEGWALFLLTKVLQWQMEEIQIFVAKFRAALNDKKNHAYYKIGVVWARKPET